MLNTTQAADNIRSRLNEVRSELRNCNDVHELERLEKALERAQLRLEMIKRNEQ
jgi:hypothetical protein